jgi:hypothetical protein
VVTPEGTVLSRQGRPLRLSVDSSGYPRFTVAIAGHRFPVRVHRLAAFQRYGEAALEPGVEVRHRDGVRANCRPDNLLLGTRRDNSLDRDPIARRRHGQHAQDGLRRLTQEQAEELRVLKRRGWSFRRLAAHFDVNLGTAWCIVRNRTYVDLAPEVAA